MKTFTELESKLVAKADDDLRAAITGELDRVAENLSARFGAKKPAIVKAMNGLADEIFAMLAASARETAVSTAISRVLAADRSLAADVAAEATKGG